MRVVNVVEMRDIEQRADRDYALNGQILMDHAGRSVATVLRERLGERLGQSSILILIGPGNNGGDGRVMGRYLAEWGASVTYYAWRERRLEIGARAIPVADDLAMVREAIAQSAVVADALLGTGTARPLTPSMRELLAAVAAEKQRRPGLFILAVDLPTGLNTDTGAVDEGTLVADSTVTLAFPKQGLFFFPGAAYIGELTVGSIGLPANMPIDGGLELVDEALLRPLLPKRPLDSNKGTFGKVMVVAGSPAYPGSAYLAATAAGRIGAGLVTLAVTPDMAAIYAEKLSEATFHLLSTNDVAPEQRAASLLDGLKGYRAVIIGPGLGQSDDTRAFLLATFAGIRALPDGERPRLLVDADGLNNLAQFERWWEHLPAETVITPHPGEMTRLRGGAKVSGGGLDRLHVITEAARDWHLTVVLKGANTLIASPDGAVRINAPGNPALATAGTGDVLAGTIGGLLAQGLAPLDAACAGVYLHSRAGLRVSERIGDAGLLASDLLPELPLALHALKIG